jgi:hypothetical protein
MKKIKQLFSKIKQLFGDLRGSNAVAAFWANRFYLLSLVAIAFGLKLLFLSTGLTTFVSVAALMYFSFWVLPPKAEKFLLKHFPGRK